jgi:hypothetical protein
MIFLGLLAGEIASQSLSHSGKERNCEHFHASMSACNPANAGLNSDFRVRIFP